MKKKTLFVRIVKAVLLMLVAMIAAYLLFLGGVYISMWLGITISLAILGELGILLVLALLVYGIVLLVRRSS